MSLRLARPAGRPTSRPAGLRDPGRRQLLYASALGAGTLALAGLADAATETDEKLDRALHQLLFGDPISHQVHLETIKKLAGPDAAASLIFSLRFSRSPSGPIAATLRAITGHDADDWFDWMLWQERTPEVVPRPSHTELRRELFLRIDPNFDVFLRPEHLAREDMGIRFEEVTWGGVRKDGIPALNNPDLIAAGDANYLRDDDPVFGVSVNGDARAYPLRIMGWHEMFNDVVGGVPLALAYCTLCGAGILFETELEGFERPLVFGSSGFLYRSNKLMYDTATHSLWNQFSGRPVVGPLAGRPIELRQRPVTVAYWGAWRSANPGTRVLSLDTGYARDYGSGVVYRDYFASPDLMFPASVDESYARQKDVVFGIRTFGGAKAWPLAAFDGGRVINDGVAGAPLVLVGDAAANTVRAYERGERTFTTAEPGMLSDGTELWSVTEEALVAPSGTRLPRVAGHLSYWFAWNGYVGAASELYEG